jgi:hypothetical protein
VVIIVICVSSIVRSNNIAAAMCPGRSHRWCGEWSRVLIPRGGSQLTVKSRFHD